MEEEKPIGQYDFDLFIIGGGSGGLACSSQASQYDIKVGIADFVQPSTLGNSWGLGGTCVNVGCIPKKLMHQCSILGEQKIDQKESGWDINVEAKHNWETLVSTIRNHIKSLNFGYTAKLRKTKVQYYNAYARLLNDHQISLTKKNSEVVTVTAKYILFAVGLRPTIPDQLIPKKQLLVTSDDIFSLQKPPGKTLIIGASYIALETASFLKALGYDVTVMVRSILLRGFDLQMAEKVGEILEHDKIKFLKECIPEDVDKLENGKLKIKYSKSNDKKQIFEEEYDTIMIATGRNALTGDLGLEKVNIKIDQATKKIIVDEFEQTNVPHIFALGDCALKRPELTPPAIKAGQLLANRLFDNSKDIVDYTNIPTTVFTSVEYSCCGLSEEDAKKKYGDDNVDVYHTSFKPLEWTFNHDHPNDICYIKVIVNNQDSERIIGIHYLGPNAGEVMQGYAVAMKLGATKKDLDRTIGIHPTCTENVVQLTTTKRESESVSKGGC